MKSEIHIPRFQKIWLIPLFIIDWTVDMRRLRSEFNESSYVNNLLYVLVIGETEE